MAVVDFAFLEGFMAGDAAVVHEVLDLFRQQAQAWRPHLDPEAPGWRDTVHTIKGSARGIGANALGDLCAVAEEKGAGALPALVAGLDAAIAEIDAYQARP